MSYRHPNCPTAACVALDECACLNPPAPAAEELTAAEVDERIRKAAAEGSMIVGTGKKCRVCFCTDEQACSPPCYWMPGEDLCSSCALTIRSIAVWLLATYDSRKRVGEEAAAEMFGRIVGEAGEEYEEIVKELSEQLDGIDAAS